VKRDTEMIVKEEKRNMKYKCKTIIKKETEMIVKEEINDVKSASCVHLGSKVKLTEIQT
jgi:hypothetical protein